MRLQSPAGRRPKPPQAPSFEKYLKARRSWRPCWRQSSIPAAQHVDGQCPAGRIVESRGSIAPSGGQLRPHPAGASGMEIDLKLCGGRARSCQDMEKLNFFGPSRRWKAEKDADHGRMGTTASAENIFTGYQDGEDANLGWFHSPGTTPTCSPGGTARVGVGRQPDCGPGCSATDRARRDSSLPCHNKSPIFPLLRFLSCYRQPVESVFRHEREFR